MSTTTIAHFSRAKALTGAVCVLGLSAALLAVPIDYDAVGDYGYLGVFLTTLITTGAFVLPVPYLAVIFKAGTFLNPAVVALVAGVAAALGELTGLIIGRSGRALVPDGRWYSLAEHWMRRHGFVTVAIASFIPNPAFDIVGIIAGAVRYPARRFCIACFFGKTLKFLLIAYFGAALFFPQ